jgi:hypothetical protein
VTPNAGLGGNAAFESAAALANSIKSLVDSSENRPTFEAIKHSLKQYEISRYNRSSELMKAANSVTRLQALRGLMERFTVFVIFPRAGDILSDMMGDWLIGAAKIDYLPPPARSLRGTMPFNPDQGVGKKESIMLRLLLALPFLALSALAFKFMTAAGSGLNGIGEMLTEGRITLGDNSFALPETFYHIGWLDDKFRPLTIMFASSNFEIDPIGWWQMFSFITDFGVLYSIILIESTRRSNNLTFAQL